MKKILINALIFVAIYCVLFWPSLAIAFWLADLGMFGTCREGNCAYGALFEGAPLICAVLSAGAMLVWLRLRRQRSP